MQTEIETSASLPILEKGISVVYKKYQTSGLLGLSLQVNFASAICLEQKQSFTWLSFFILQHFSLIVHRNLPQSNHSLTLTCSGHIHWLAKVILSVLCSFNHSLPCGHSVFLSRPSNTASFISQGKLQVISEYGQMRYEETRGMFRLR